MSSKLKKQITSHIRNNNELHTHKVIIVQTSSTEKGEEDDPQQNERESDISS